jgi:hypothetical protein
MFVKTQLSRTFRFSFLLLLALKIKKDLQGLKFWYIILARPVEHLARTRSQYSKVLSVTHLNPRNFIPARTNLEQFTNFPDYHIIITLLV